MSWTRTRSSINRDDSRMIFYILEVDLTVAHPEEDPLKLLIGLDVNYIYVVEAPQFAIAQPELYANKSQKRGLPLKPGERIFVRNAVLHLANLAAPAGTGPLLLACSSMPSDYREI